MRYRIYTDGSWNKEKDIGGWAMIIADHQGLKLKSGSKKGTTNNQMELTAVLNALEYAVRKHLKDIEIIMPYIIKSYEISKYNPVDLKNNFIELYYK